MSPAGLLGLIGLTLHVQPSVMSSPHTSLPHTFQVSAVQQALHLLAGSLDDTHLAVAAIHAAAAADLEEGEGGGGGGGGGLAAGLLQGEGSNGLAESVSRADSRAENVSRMARQLLSVLREFPRRDVLPPLGKRGGP